MLLSYLILARLGFGRCARARQGSSRFPAQVRFSRGAGDTFKRSHSHPKGLRSPSTLWPPLRQVFFQVLENRCPPFESKSLRTAETAHINRPDKINVDHRLSPHRDPAMLRGGNCGQLLHGPRTMSTGYIYLNEGPMRILHFQAESTHLI